MVALEVAMTHPTALRPQDKALRRHDKAMPDAEAREMLQRESLVHLGSTTEDGSIVLRPLHPIFLPSDETRVFFHGTALGERGSLAGRPASIGCEQVLGDIPSTATGPDRACPATTYFESVMAHGILEDVTDTQTKAAALQALMVRFQAEGGYRPIDPSAADFDRLYKNAVRSISIVALKIDSIVGKRSLGQTKSPAARDKIVTTVWTRGRPNDAKTVDAIVNARPTEAPLPALVAGPDGIRFHVAPPFAHAEEAAAPLENEYWNQLFDRPTLRDAHLGCDAWIVATSEGRVVASARALTDGAKRALVMDVVVASDKRRKGIGRALLGLLLDHPRVRHVGVIELGTRDAMAFYEEFGFEYGEKRHTSMTRLSHPIREKANNSVADYKPRSPPISVE